MRERLMQIRLVLALIKLAKRPVQKMGGLACANGKVAGAHIEKIERMMAAIGDTTPKRGGSLDHDEAERSLDMRQASDGRRGASKAAADHANAQGRIRHANPNVDSPVLGRSLTQRAPVKLQMAHAGAKSRISSGGQRRLSSR